MRSLSFMGATACVILAASSCGEEQRRGESHTDAGQDASPGSSEDGGLENDGGDGGLECFDKIDICFVLDVSTSMGFVLDGLTDEIGAVWQKAADIDDDPQFGLVVFVDRAVAQNNGQPFPTVQAIQAAFQDVKSFTSSNVEPDGTGSNADCPENTLDALVIAAERYPWREGSVRIIIHATDDTFAEPPQQLSGVAVQHTYTETLDALTAREIRVACFAAHENTCAIQPGVNVEPGFFASYKGQPSIPEATGGHVFDIQKVAANALSMAEAISDVILDEYCTPYLE